MSLGALSVASCVLFLLLLATLWTLQRRARNKRANSKARTTKRRVRREASATHATRKQLVARAHAIDAARWRALRLQQLRDASGLFVL